MRYQAVYKCRLCGKIYFGPYVEEDKVKSILPIAVLDKTKFAIRHTCKDKSLGIADFQGFKLAEE